MATYYETKLQIQADIERTIQKKKTIKTKDLETYIIIKYAVGRLMVRKYLEVLQDAHFITIQDDTITSISDGDVR